MEEKWVTEWGQQASRSWGWRKLPASENSEVASVWGCGEAGNELQEYREMGQSELSLGFITGMAGPSGEMPTPGAPLGPGRRQHT